MIALLEIFTKFGEFSELAVTNLLTELAPVFDVAALVRSRMTGLQPFESTIEQTTETMPP